MGTRLRLYRSYLRSKLIRSLLGQNASAVLYETSGGRFLVRAGDTTIGRRLGHRGSYGEAELAELAPLLRSETRVLFVGAHVGTILVPVARRVAFVCGIEANPDTHALLQMNLLLNGITNAVTHNYAAGDTRATVEFLKNVANTGGSKIRPLRQRYEFVYDHPIPTTVEMMPLDELLANDCFDVIVMDVEGAETRALRGMQRLLAACSALVIEFRRGHLEHVGQVSEDEFLGAFAPHFTHVRILGNPEGPARVHGEFAEVLRGAEGRDLLFTREPVGAPG